MTYAELSHTVCEQQMELSSSAAKECDWHAKSVAQRLTRQQTPLRPSASAGCIPLWIRHWLRIWYDISVRTGAYLEGGPRKINKHRPTRTFVYVWNISKRGILRCLESTEICFGRDSIRDPVADLAIHLQTRYSRLGGETSSFAKRIPTPFHACRNSLWFHDLNKLCMISADTTK